MIPRVGVRPRSYMLKKRRKGGQDFQIGPDIRLAGQLDSEAFQQAGGHNDFTRVRCAMGVAFRLPGLSEFGSPLRHQHGPGCQTHFSVWPS